MPTPQHRQRLMTLEELLRPRHDDASARCNHCGRDGADRDYEMVQEALRGRIQALEVQVRALEAELVGRFRNAN